MPHASITDRQTAGLESEICQIATLLTQPKGSIKIASMEISVMAAPAAPKEAPIQQPQSLDALYARLDQTQPGSEESNRVSEEILNAIG